MNIRRIVLMSVLLLLPPVIAEAGHIERLEPPSWWVGFTVHNLQLLVYGDGLSEWIPQVDYPGVTISRVEHADSPNYLFIYLEIDAETRPGTLDIRFSRGGESIDVPYTLHQKNPDPSWTRGFGPSDAIYLITPDRFANGNPNNDTVAGMGDPSDRTDPNGRHGGDLEGIGAHLDYVADLGATAVWLNPVLENRMPQVSYHGYATTDFYRVDPRLGTNESYRGLVEKARTRGIGIIMDMIVNHIGRGHWWMKDLPSHDWINFDGKFVATSNEHITQQDPHASDYDRRRFSDGWFDDPMPDLNQHNPLLADYLVQNALWWIEYLGLAGIRMDTYPYPDKHYMAAWSRRIMEEYPDFNIVGEEGTDNPAAVAYWQRGQQNHDGYVSWLPSLMDFPLQSALRWGLVTAEASKLVDERPGGLEYLYRVLANDFVYPDPGALVIFPDNHDMSRIFSQLGGAYDLFRMAVAYVLTMRGVPQIYYGTEILMANPGTEEHGVIRSDFPGGWVGDKVNAFTGEGLSERQLDAQAYLRKLLRWRRDTAVLHSGRTMQFVPENGTYVYFRYDDTDCVMVVFNKNAEAVDLPLARFAERLQGYAGVRDVLTGTEEPLGESLTLPARSVRILDLR